MRVRSMSAERFFDLSARLLAGAAVLTALGLGLVVRFAWKQAAQSYGPDGTATDLAVPFRDHLAMVMLDFSYRQSASSCCSHRCWWRAVVASCIATHRGTTPNGSAGRCWPQDCWSSSSTWDSPRPISIS